MKSASTDKTYCVNMDCSKKSFCDRHKSNVIFKDNELYSFAEFKEKNCPWKKVVDDGNKERI